jgi:hypothetical protein
MAVRWWISVGLVAVAVCALGGSGRGEEPAGDARENGMRVHVDPRSGRFVPEPVVPRAEPLPAPPPPLAEEPAPGGGTMVRMRGHFMSNLVATVNPDGSVRVDCVTGDAPVPTDR